MGKKLAILFVVSLSLAVAGCGGRKNVKENIPVGEAAPGSDTAGLGDDGLSSSGLAGPSSSDPNDPLNKRVIYFDYDSSNLDAESQAVAEAHANWLVNNAGTSVILEGHADERGTREYNLALAEDRAKSVARIMQALGVSSSNIQSISYGEERPAALGQGEGSWSLNRRVEILYGG